MTKASVVIPSDIIGKQVKYNAFGVGVITGISGALIEVKFDKAEEKEY